MSDMEELQKKQIAKAIENLEGKFKLRMAEMLGKIKAGRPPYEVLAERIVKNELKLESLYNAIAQFGKDDNAKRDGITSSQRPEGSIQHKVV